MTPKIEQKKDWYYFIKKSDNWKIPIKITDFFIEVIDCLNVDTELWLEKSLLLEIRHNNTKTIDIFWYKDTTDWLSFKKKIRKINPFCNLFNFKTEYLDELLIFILKDKKPIYTTIITKKWYIPKHNCWVFKEWIIFEQKFYEFDKHQIADLWHIKLKLEVVTDYYLPSYEEKYYDQDIKNYIIPHFQHMFWWINWDLVLWFLMATLFVNSLKKELKPFPILFVFWKKWSWKSTALTEALKILWIINSCNNVEWDTEFIDRENMNIISSMPYWWDEYKNWKKAKEKENLHKTIFDRVWTSKWAIIDGKLWSFTIPVNATLILSWEQTPNDDALFTRICYINVPMERQWNLFEEIKIKSDYYPSIIRYLLEKHDFNSLVETYKKILNTSINLLKSKWIEKRLLDVYSPIMAWYLFYKNIFLWENWISETWINTLITKINEKNEKEDEDILDNFFNNIFFLFTKWHIKEQYDEHIRYNKDDNIMQINFPYLYSLYNEYIKDDKISKKDLKNYLEKQYWTYRSSMIKNFPEKNDWITTEISVTKRNHTLSFKLKKDKYPKIFDDYFNINFK